MRHKTLAAACLVFIGSTDLDAFFRFHRALGIVRGTAALNTDGMRLGDKFGDRQQLWHRFEWLTGVILVEPGNDHALTVFRKLVYCRHKLHIEELSLVYPDNLRIRFYARHHFGRRADRIGEMRLA